MLRTAVRSHEALPKGFGGLSSAFCAIWQSRSWACLASSSFPGRMLGKIGSSACAGVLVGPCRWRRSGSVLQRDFSWFRFVALVCKAQAAISIESIALTSARHLASWRSPRARQSGRRSQRGSARSVALFQGRAIRSARARVRVCGHFTGPLGNQALEQGE